MKEKVAKQIFVGETETKCRCCLCCVGDVLLSPTALKRLIDRSHWSRHLATKRSIVTPHRPETATPVGPCPSGLIVFFRVDDFLCSCRRRACAWRSSHEASSEPAQGVTEDRGRIDLTTFRRKKMRQYLGNFSPATWKLSRESSS